MRKIAFITVLAACLCSCTGNRTADPFVGALESEIIRLVGADAKVSFNSVERIDSTTFGQELDNRIKAMETRQKQNRKFLDQYNMKGQKKSAAAKSEALIKDEQVIAGLNAIKERLAAADSLGIVAYYDYHFSGSARCEGQETAFPDNYASISPDGVVLSLNDSQKGLHNALGKVIPGYTDLLKAE